MLWNVLFSSLLTFQVQVTEVPADQKKAITIINQLNEDTYFQDALFLFEMKKNQRNATRLNQQFLKIVGDAPEDLIRQLRQEYSVPMPNDFN